MERDRDRNLGFHPGSSEDFSLILLLCAWIPLTLYVVRLDFRFLDLFIFMYSCLVLHI